MTQFYLSISNPRPAPRPLILACLLAILSPGLPGCTQQQEKEPIIALVNGQAITQTDFELRWRELSEATRNRYEKEGGKRRFLDDLVTRELLLQEARRRRVDQDDVIREKIQRYKEQLILDELLKNKLQSKVEITEDELSAYLEAHASELLAPLKVQVSLMLLPNLYAAKDLEARVNQGSNFASLAKRYSIHEASKANGGNLGPYRKGLVVPEVDAVIQTLATGLVSAPIKTDDGYYLVMTTPLDQETIEADLAIQERLRQELLADKRRKRFEEVIAGIRANATIRLGDASRYVTEEPGNHP